MNDPVEVNRCALDHCRIEIPEGKGVRRYGEIFCCIDHQWEKFPGAVGVGPHSKEALDETQMA